MPRWRCAGTAWHRLSLAHGLGVQPIPSVRLGCGSVLSTLETRIYDTMPFGQKPGPPAGEVPPAHETTPHHTPAAPARSKVIRAPYSRSGFSGTSGEPVPSGHREGRAVSRSSIFTDPGRSERPQPGDILRTEFLKPMGLGRNALDRDITIPPRRIDGIVHGKKAATAEADLRRARYFGFPQGFSPWYQADHDLMNHRCLIASALAHFQPRTA